MFTDVGQHQMWASQYLDVNKNKRMITSGGLGTMGLVFRQHLVQKWDTGQRCVCITGDGGFQMNMQEMATAVVQQTPITVCLLNNYLPWHGATDAAAVLWKTLFRNLSAPSQRLSGALQGTK